MTEHTCNWFNARPEVRTPTSEFGTLFVAARCRVCGRKRIWFEIESGGLRFLTTTGAGLIQAPDGQPRRDFWLQAVPRPWSTAAVAALRRLEDADIAPPSPSAPAASPAPAPKPATPLVAADLRRLAKLIRTYLPAAVWHSGDAKPSAEKLAAWAESNADAPAGVLTQPRLL